MRGGLVVALLLAGCASGSAGSPAPVVTAVPDQIWKGTLHCDVMLPVVHIPLNQPITVTVHDGAASFERKVLVSDTSIASGYTERASGPVGPDGAVTLTGQGLSRQASYSSEYRGVLPPSGRPAELVGQQTWHIPRVAVSERACTLSLRRAG